MAELTTPSQRTIIFPLRVPLPPSSQNNSISMIDLSSFEKASLYTPNTTLPSIKSMYVYYYYCTTCDVYILIFVVKDDIPFCNARAAVSFNSRNQVSPRFKSNGIFVHLRVKVETFGSSIVKIDPGKFLNGSARVFNLISDPLPFILLYSSHSFFEAHDFSR